MRAFRFINILFVNGFSIRILPPTNQTSEMISGNENFFVGTLKGRVIISLTFRGSLHKITNTREKTWMLIAKKLFLLSLDYVVIRLQKVVGTRHFHRIPMLKLYRHDTIFLKATRFFFDLFITHLNVFRFILCGYKFCNLFSLTFSIQNYN